MKEYITDTIYDASGLVIGYNHGATSLIFGQNNEWIVLDNMDIKRVIENLKKNKVKCDFDGFNYTMRPKGILFNQHNNSVYVDRNVFATITERSNLS